jgi:hypothetical protein
MSRTYKDKPSRLKYDRYDKDMVVYSTEEVTKDHHYYFENGEFVRKDLPEEDRRTYTRICYIYGKTTKPKKRKEHDTEWHWMSTPSWWTRLTMTRPQRRAGKIWERKVLFEDIEDADPPDVGRKPHIYYY